MLILLLFRPFPLKSFFQKKKEKKKAIQGALAKPKGNGISPLGGAPKKQTPAPLCRSLLAVFTAIAAMRAQLGWLFFLLLKKIKVSPFKVIEAH
ncbi:hypothetical protein [Mucilaginibacter sp. dw_454]|uniref:hypothetical protein n=1 Tax=Mucilaginibacter sp. dw_454 TaxID=2720079 RepID=UPI001BD3C531|nr:hypothetical protein [Mucilaginibacter sp. dw_454]